MFTHIFVSLAVLELKKVEEMRTTWKQSTGVEHTDVKASGRQGQADEKRGEEKLSGSFDLKGSYVGLGVECVRRLKHEGR